MKLQLKNGATVGCSNPIEQKIFKNGCAAGWICSLSITDRMTSVELDELCSEDNMAELNFLTDDGEVFATLKDYSRLTSAIIRHSDLKDSIDIQLTKTNMTESE